LAARGGVPPPKVSAAILRGDSRLKAIRNWRSETQVTLASKTGNGQGYLSDLESGRRAGAPETIAKVAQALNVPEGWLSQLHVARQTIAGTRGEIGEQQDHAASSATPYVATWHIECDPGSDGPLDPRCIGKVDQAEYERTRCVRFTLLAFRAAAIARDFPANSGWNLAWRRTPCERLALSLWSIARSS